MPPSPRIGVLGPHECSREDYALGFAVGAAIARRGGILLCGGLTGIMTAAAEGARSARGLTIGILPGERDEDANPFIDIPLPTGAGALRNALLVRACHAVIAVRGEYGTLSEIGFALRLKVPVVGLGTWSVVRNGKPDPAIHVAETPDQAVELAFQLAGRPRAS